MINSVNSPPSAHWFNHIPDEWSITRLANVADILFSNVDKHTIEGEVPVRLCNYVDVYKNERITNEIEFMDASADAREIERFQILADDVLATKDSESPDDIAISALVTENLPGVLCGYHLALIRPRKHLVYGPYLAWLHGCKLFRSHYEANAVGVTRFGLSQAAFREARIPLPTLAEQHRIASFLDKTCATVDTAIEKKQKQLETLDALRKSIIHKAVTRGLDNSVELKDSGVEWIGKVPKHWRVEKLKRFLERPLMYGTNEVAELDDMEFPRYIRITDFDDNGSLRDDTFKSLPPDKAEGYYLVEGDVLFARSGATVGKSFLFNGYDGKACFAGYLIKAQANKHKLLPEYLYYFTKSPSYDSWKNVIFTQATIQNISATKYAYLPITVPPTTEQRRILEYLDSKMDMLLVLQENLSNQISALDQYRKSLIHECVTGKRRITEHDLKEIQAHV
jgi:type I restriction enzyme S subunit